MLAERHIAGAGPDVLCRTDQIFAGNGASDVRAVLAVMAGRAPDTVVNCAVLDSAEWRAKLRSYGEKFGVS